MSPTKASLERRNENLFKIANNGRGIKESPTVSGIPTVHINLSDLYHTSEISSYSDFSESNNCKIKKWIILYNLNEKIKLLHKIEKEIKLTPKQSYTEPQLSPSYKAKLIKLALENK